MDEKQSSSKYVQTQILFQTYEILTVFIFNILLSHSISINTINYITNMAIKPNDLNNKTNSYNSKMQNKAQMTTTKLVLLLLGLTIIWVMCSQAQHQFPSRFQDDLVNRMGGHLFNSTKLNLALDIKANTSKQSITAATNTLNQIYTKSYNLQTVKEEQLVCVVIRDFDREEKGDSDYNTIRSVMRQDYLNYHIIYLSEESDSSVDKVKSYMTVNQLLDDKYNFVSAPVDTIDALFRATEKCPQDGIMLLLENGQKLASSLVFKVLNANFVDGVDFTWASSLYANNKLGFSFQYSKQIIKSKSYRKYPLAANDVIAFKNSLFVKNRSFFTEHRLYYPMYMTESIGFTFLDNAKQFKYIPEILTFKEKNYRLRSDRSSLEKQLEDLIREDKPILGLLKSVANAENK